MKRIFHISELIQIAKETANDVLMSLNYLDPEKPQSRDNDFSEPLVICEDLIKVCNEIMEKADSQ